MIQHGVTARLNIIFIRKGDEPSAEVSLEERRSDDGFELEVDRDSFIVPVELGIKEQTSNEALNAKYPEVIEASETPGPPSTRSSCPVTDRDSRGRERLTSTNEKISVKLSQTETDTIHQAHFKDLVAEPDPEWITKIKTFKITKVSFIMI